MAEETKLKLINKMTAAKVLVLGIGSLFNIQDQTLSIKEKGDTFSGSLFNPIDVRLRRKLTLEGISSEKPKSYVLQFDSREISIATTPVKTRLIARPESAHRLRVAVAEQAGAKKVILLDPEIITPGKNSAVLGFESMDGFPYISFPSTLSLAQEPGKFGQFSYFLVAATVSLLVSLYLYLTSLPSRR